MTQKAKRKLEFAPGIAATALPPLLQPGARTESTPAPAVAPAATPTAPEPEVTATAAVKAPRTPSQGRSRAARAQGTEATYSIESELMERVRAEHNRLRASQSGVSYVRMVLQAIQDNQEELSQAWQRDESSDPAEGGAALFARLVEETPTQRPPTTKLTLAGVRPEERDALYQLVDEWKAPSLTALIERALSLQYPPSKRKR